MEDVDDDFVVIIVENKDAVDHNLTPVDVKDKISVKEEIPDTLPVEELIKAAEEYGEHIDFVNIKEELSDEDYQYENIESDASYVDNEERNNNDEDSDHNDDKEYVPDHDTDSDEDKIRRVMKKPWQRKSFVRDLIKENPSFKKDKKALIDKLVEVMRSVKTPELPYDFCKVNDVNFECSKCGALLDTVAAAARHYQEKHGKRYLICYACGVDFRSTTNLYKHEKRCIAPDANVVLKARAIFVGRKGRSRPFLQYDIAPKKKYKGKPQQFDCDQCSAKFLSKIALTSHQYHHQGIRPYQCKECPNAYTSPSALVRHEKKHSDVQYICDHCGRTFKLKATLSSHMDTHRPLKKHACTECDRRYAQKSALLLHVNREHRHLPPPCACKICPRRFPRMSLLKTHMKKAHGMLLMTRKMFFKSVPTMPDIGLEKAKLVLKSEVMGPTGYHIFQDTNIDTEQYNKNKKTKQSKNKGDTEEINNIQLTEEFMEILKTMQSEISDNVKIMVIENGELKDASLLCTDSTLDIISDGNAGVSLVQNKEDLIVGS